jgi:homoserine O-acetyltransferase/O-succinyltransferase
MSDDSMREKFGRRLRSKEKYGFDFSVDFEVESYLRYRGSEFVNRFDANSYLYITRALDYVDLAAQHGGVLAEAFRKARGVRFCVLSFSSDWLYPTAESRDVVRALNAAGCRASFAEIETDKGHDAFFLDEPQLDRTLRGFFAATAQARGL